MEKNKTRTQQTADYNMMPNHRPSSRQSSVSKKWNEIIIYSQWFFMSFPLITYTNKCLLFQIIKPN